MQAPTPVIASTLSEASKPSTKTAWLIISLVAFLVVGGGVWAAISLLINNSQPNNSSQAAVALFDDMLRTAAAKTTTRLTYSQLDFADRNSFANNAPEDQTYSVSEFDLLTKDYRALFATTTGGATRFEAMRCLDGKTLRSANQPLIVGYQTIKATQKAFEQPFSDDVTQTRGDACALSDPGHTARITDGIIPVGLSSTQIAAWLSMVHKNAGLTISDQGTTTYRHKKVRQLHLATNGIAGSGIFTYILAKSTGIELKTPDGQPGKEAYRLENMAMSSDIDGFYLIDEQSKLPLYSQFTSTQLVKDQHDPGSKNGKMVKYAYEYPQNVTLSQASSLVIAEWSK